MLQYRLGRGVRESSQKDLLSTDNHCLILM